MNENNVPKAVLTALSALRQNHQWHQDYDDHGGYEESELAAVNTNAIERLEAFAAAPVAQPPATAEAAPPFSELARLTQWLDTKFARHGEQEDADASKLLHTLWRAALATQPPAPVQQTEAVVEVSKLVEAVTKAIVFEDCGNTEGWRDNINLGEAAIRVCDARNPPRCSYCHASTSTPLYATPPAPVTALPPVARVPLSRERILQLWGDRSDGPPTHQIISFARAVEASTGEQSHG